MDNKSVLEEWFRRVWTEEDPNAIDEMMELETTALGLVKKDLVGPTEFKSFQQALLALVTDVDIRIERHIEDGNWISAFCKLKATKRGDGTPLEMTGQVFGKIVDGKIVHADNSFDFLGFFEQAGYLPENTLTRCLQGERIA